MSDVVANVVFPAANLVGVIAAVWSMVRLARHGPRSLTRVALVGAGLAMIFGLGWLAWLLGLAGDRGEWSEWMSVPHAAMWWPVWVVIPLIVSRRDG